MDLYYSTEIEGESIFLDEEEFRHLKVVRKNIGEEILITDGKGRLSHAKILDFGKNNCELQLTKTEKVEKAGPFLHLAISPTKNLDRMEWLVEKCVESGIEKISFMHCRHSVRKEIKIERLNRIAISAMKQSQKLFLPEINEMISFDQLLLNVIEEEKYICSMDAGSKNYIKNHLKKLDTLILIGPEGDFHPDELIAAKDSGFTTLSLGPERLRTETAALAACISFNFIKHG